MAQKHVLICNERILFRYGVDRILVELAKKFVAEGWRVTFVCLRSDEKLIRAIDAHVIVPPMPEGGELYALESACADFLVGACKGFETEAPVSLIVSGGWPFFGAAHVGDRLNIPTLFIDAGAVPHDGLDDNAASPQRAVRRLRALALPHFDKVTPISRFISESQTIPDRASAEGVEVVTLGVDHFAAMSGGEAPLADAAEQALVARLRKLATGGVRLILNLGRFERVGYKNSQAAYALLRELQARGRGKDRRDDVRLLLLADEAEAVTPADLAPAVICLGKPSDEALARIMAIADVGFSPSLWEGFNLPIGEMTILGKPVFAFNIGAHPETIFHPWFLCSGIAQAADKIDRTLAGAAPEGLLVPQKIAAFRDLFWSRTLAAYHAICEDMVARPKTPRPREKLLLVDVTNASRDTANSGVIRVTRRLTAELQRAEAARLVFVYWDKERRGYRFVAGAREALLAGYSGPQSGFAHMFAGEAEPTPDDLLRRAPGRVSRDATLLIAEFVFDGDTGPRVDWAQAHGLKTAAILYDLIPIDYPHLCGPDVRAEAPAYLEALSRVDRVIAISAYSLGRFEDYLQRRGLPLPPDRDAVWLPGQLGATQRVRAPQPESPSRAISILCVSTVEPRKNHRALLAAYDQVRRANPALDLRLTLIGNSYNGAEALAGEVRAALDRDATIEWRRAISDEELIEASRAASFTVYPSLVEGFGLPILESLWIGKPCICHSDGVMAELAAGGGCLTVDMNDPTALAQEILALATNRSLRDRLSAEARARDIDAWPDYARHVGLLLDLASPAPAHSKPAAGLAALRRRAAEDAFFLDHKLKGVGLISGLAPVRDARAAAATIPPAAPPAAAAPPRPAPPAAPPARRMRAQVLTLFGLLGAGGVTARQVRRSGLFDAAWYLETYPDVREAGIDPARHFARFGHLEGRSPGPNFNSVRYRAQWPDVDASGLSPFAHHLARNA